MLKILSAMVTVFVMQAHASDPQILGKWISADPLLQSGNVTVRAAFDFKDNTAEMSTVCSYPTKEVEAAVTVSVDVSEGKINVLNGGVQKINENGMECISTVEAGTVDYTIEDNVLRVSAEGYSMDFVRRTSLGIEQPATVQSPPQ